MLYTDKLKKGWLKFIKKQEKLEYFTQLSDFINHEYKIKSIFPDLKSILKALELTPLENVKVVIIGQDPYFNINQANGLAFSVQENTTLPPTLKNIFKELNSDLSINNSSGDLTPWAKQGVLLLNTVLTVEEGKPNSHRNKGWEKFTDNLIIELSENNKKLIFLLWGTPARKKKNLINLKNHFILESSHPSPLSSYRGFIGCKHFSKTNAILKSIIKNEINWTT